MDFTAKESWVDSRKGRQVFFFFETSIQAVGAQLAFCSLGGFFGGEGGAFSLGCKGVEA
jgi:hypothetical protein